MPYWSPLFIDNAEIDLSHLEPFEFSVLSAGLDTPATVNVRFHDHCFTKNYDSERHIQPVRSSQASSAELRAFSTERYELSKLLPGIVRQLDGQRIASTREGNMVRVTLQDGRTYPVFFTLRRESARRAVCCQRLFVGPPIPARHDRRHEIQRRSCQSAEGRKAEISGEITKKGPKGPF
jgi:hypothetical protein